MLQVFIISSLPTHWKILEELLPLGKDEQQASAVVGMLEYRGKSCQSIILVGELQLCWRVGSNA